MWCVKIATNKMKSITVGEALDCGRLKSVRAIRVNNDDGHGPGTAGVSQ